MNVLNMTDCCVMSSKIMYFLQLVLVMVRYCCAKGNWCVVTGHQGWHIGKNSLKMGNEQQHWQIINTDSRIFHQVTPKCSTKWLHILTLWSSSASASSLQVAITKMWRYTSLCYRYLQYECSNRVHS